MLFSDHALCGRVVSVSSSVTTNNNHIGAGGVLTGKYTLLHCSDWNGTDIETRSLGKLYQSFATVATGYVLCNLYWIGEINRCSARDYSQADGYS